MKTKIKYISFMCIFLVLSVLILSLLISQNTSQNEPESRTNPLVKWDNKSITLSNGDDIEQLVRYSTDSIYFVKAIHSNEVAFIKCSLSSCAAFSISIATKQESKLFTLSKTIDAYDTPQYLGGQYDWSADGKVLFIATKDRLLRLSAEGEQSLSEWSIINPEPGIGGTLCKEVTISPDQKYIAFCHSTATMNSIWGDLYIYTLDGVPIQSFESSKYTVTKLPLMWISDSELLFIDSTTNTARVLDVETSSVLPLFDTQYVQIKVSSDKHTIKLLHIKDKTERTYDLKQRQFTD